MHSRTYPTLAAFLAIAFLLPRACAYAGDAVCFEAESVETIEAPLEIIDATNAPAQLKDKVVKGASGDKYLEITEGKGYPPKVIVGKATYSFEVEKEGQYYLWCRVWWQDECGNSFSMSFDDAKPFAFGEDSTFKCWHWVKAPPGLKQLNLSKGKHKLTIKNREDGVRLDQILLTTDRKYVPVDIESVTVKEKNK